MASEAEIAELSSLFERMIRNRDMSLVLPFFFGLSESSSISRNNNDPDQESENNDDSNRQRIILVNPLTQGMVVIEGVSSLEDLFNQLGSNKNGQPPASKESIEAMKKVEIGEGDDDGGECVVCLDEFEVGGVVKEMHCKHRFHGDCIEKWLGLHGSCPVCRYQMPVDEKGDGKKSDEEEGGERRRVGGGGGNGNGNGGGEVWVSFSFNRRSRENQNQATSGGDDDDDVEVEN
ncbi:RING/U-box superfamily protein [Trifolium repens]|nr:RING/U-box superfamily protein [Trifolium repens]